MNVNDIDLNLLKIFEAVYVEGSVSRAARRIGLTQPSVSHALVRTMGPITVLWTETFLSRNGSWVSRL